MVKLEVNQGRASEEGSGVILSTDGLILTNNHVVASAAETPDGQAGAPQTKVTFADGNTAPFTVVGTDPGSDIAVVRAAERVGSDPDHRRLLRRPAGRSGRRGDRFPARPARAP